MQNHLSAKTFGYDGSLVEGNKYREILLPFVEYKPLMENRIQNHRSV
jgi:hypothetical protein